MDCLRKKKCMDMSMAPKLENNSFDRFYDSSEESERFERKVVFSSGKKKLIESRLKINGFREIFYPRNVTSIYFDNHERDCLMDNINGNRYRNKVRLRYYDQDTSSCVLEIKMKRGLVGRKYTIPFPIKNKQFLLSNDASMQKIKRWILVNLNFYPEVSAITKYSRSYFKKGSIRATVDSNLHSSIRSEYTDFHPQGRIFNDILEFKYKLDKEIYLMQQDIERIFPNIAVRPMRVSKYVSAYLKR